MSALRIRSKRLMYGTGALVLAAALATTLFFATRPSHQAPAAANVSRNMRACLLTTTASATDAQTTAAVWAGLLKASATGRVNAERLPLPTNDPAAALPYFNGAVQQRCALIVSVGQTMEPAVQSAAAADQSAHFLVVGVAATAQSAPRPNVSEIPQAAADAVTSDTVTNAVYTQVMAAAGS